jgi:hypothetical protein
MYHYTLMLDREKLGLTASHMTDPRMTVLTFRDRSRAGVMEKLAAVANECAEAVEKFRVQEQLIDSKTED